MFISILQVKNDLYLKIRYIQLIMKSFQDWEPVVLKKNIHHHNNQPKTSNISVSQPKVEYTEDGEEVMKKIRTWDIKLIKALQEARKAKGLTQEKLANMMNMKGNIIKDIESNNTPYNEKLYRTIMRRLGVDLKTI